MTTVSPHAAGTRAPNPLAPSVSKPVFDWFFGLAIVAVICLYVRALAFTPADSLLGDAQKIYYIHISAWLSGYTAVGLTAVCSLVYLWLHDERADRLGEACAEVGLVFLTVGLVGGSIWAHSSWGAWWVWWDMRLTLALFLWFVVAAYLVLRGAIENETMRARYSAVVGVLAALLIPFIHLSVYLFQARLHPMPVVLKPSAPNLSPEMLITFLGSFVAFLLLCVAFIRARYRLALMRDRVAELSIDGGLS